ncbi:hypothetical protein PG987_010111 [Apiospora arundinis]
MNDDSEVTASWDKKILVALCLELILDYERILETGIQQRNVFSGEPGLSIGLRFCRFVWWVLYPEEFADDELREELERDYLDVLDRCLLLRNFNREGILIIINQLHVGDKRWEFNVIVAESS